MSKMVHVQSTHLCFKSSIFVDMISIITSIDNYEDLFLKQRAFVGSFFGGQKINLGIHPFSMTPHGFMVSWSQTRRLHIKTED